MYMYCKNIIYIMCGHKYVSTHACDCECTYACMELCVWRVCTYAYYIANYNTKCAM